MSKAKINLDIQKKAKAVYEDPRKTYQDFLGECQEMSLKYKDRTDYKTLLEYYKEQCEFSYKAVKNNAEKVLNDDKARKEAFQLKLNIDARLAVKNGKSLKTFTDEVKKQSQTIGADSESAAAGHRKFTG